MSTCILCNEDVAQVVYRNQLFRIILPNESLYPGFVRLILNSHYKEMTDLSLSDANKVFNALLTIEKLVRQYLNPNKVNVASLGNVVPHLHWHIIPRFYNDAHYPNPIWGEKTNPQYTPPEILYNQVSGLALALATAFES